MNKHIFCPHCGKKIPAQSHICPYCGKPVNKDIPRNAKTTVKQKPKKSAPKNNARKLNGKQKTTMWATIAVIAVLLIGAFWIYDQNSIAFVNLQNTLPGKTWEQETMGVNFNAARYKRNIAYNQNKGVYDRETGANYGPTAIKIERHNLRIYYKPGGLYTDLKLIGRHGDKYTFKYVRVPFPVRPVFPNSPREKEMNVYDGAHLVTDGVRHIHLYRGAMYNTFWHGGKDGDTWYTNLSHHITFKPTHRAPFVRKPMILVHPNSDTKN